MASNDDSPEPPPGLTVEDFKKTNTLDVDKLQETNPFIELISHLQDENIIHNLRKCILVSPAVSDNDVEKIDSSEDDTVGLKDLFELVEKAKKNRLVTLKETSSESENIPSNQTPDWRFYSRVDHSSSLSPSVETPCIETPDRTSNFRRKRVSSSSSFCRPSSRSSDCSRRRSSQTTLSSNRRSLGSRSKVCSLSRRYCSSRCHGSYDSRSTSPEDTYYRKKEKDCHKPFHYHRSYDYCKRSPEDTAYCHKNKKDYPKGFKSRRSLFRKRSNSRESVDGEDVPHNKKEVDRRKRFRHYQSWDSCCRSTKNTYYCDKNDRLKYRKSRQVPYRESWSSKRSTDEENTTPKKRLKSDASMKSWSNKFRNFSIESEGEHSLMLEELKSVRRLLPDSIEKHDVRMKKGRRLARIDSDEDQTNIIILESDDESEKVSEVKIFPDNKKNVKEENEIPDKKFNIPNNFFCNVCQLALSSELTWESHIHGKNHAKQIRKQAVYEVSKGSLSVPVTPTIVSENVSRFANAPHGKKLIHINAIPRLQQTINGTRSIPLPGLDYVQEIISDKEVKYYCELCDAPCQSISILPHLVGIRHQLMVVREIAPVFYEQNKIRQDKKFMLKIKSILMTHERREGRGSIKVFREIDDRHSRPAYNQPGPSWRNFSLSSIKKEPNKGESENDTSKDKDRWLDMSKGVFYCTLCDSHMNNLNMWEAHVRGKRHLANAKKIPGESISKMKSERLHGATSILEAMIDEELVEEIVVGLDFVRETRGSNGEIFNCFLCGACSTKIDILDHILLLKHRTKYLEKLHADGFENSIKEIDNLELKENSFRIALINNECVKMLRRYGRGKVEVYQSKKRLSQLLI